MFLDWKQSKFVTSKSVTLVCKCVNIILNKYFNRYDSEIIYI